MLRLKQRITSYWPSAVARDRHGCTTVGYRLLDNQRRWLGKGPVVLTPNYPSSITLNLPKSDYLRSPAVATVLMVHSSKSRSEES